MKTIYSIEAKDENNDTVYVYEVLFYHKIFDAVNYFKEKFKDNNKFNIEKLVIFKYLIDNNEILKTKILNTIKIGDI